MSQLGRTPMNGFQSSDAKRLRTLIWIVSLATVGFMFDGYDLVVYGTVVSTFLRDPNQIGPVDPALHFCVERRQLVDIGAADKGAAAGSGHRHQAQRRVVGKPAHCFDDLAHRRAVERVELRRAIDRDPRDEPACHPRLARNLHRHPGTLFSAEAY